MPNTLTITKTYADSLVSPLSEAELDGFKSSLETFCNTTKLTADNIQTASVTLAKVAAIAVTKDKLNTSVAGTGLTGGAGTALSVNVDNSSVEVSSNQLRVKDGGITTAMQAAVGHQVSSSVTASFVNASGSNNVTVTGLTCTITTTGRPVWIQLIPDTASTTADRAIIAVGGGAGSLKLQVDGVDIGVYGLNSSLNGGAPGQFLWIDNTSTAGSHTYQVVVGFNGGVTLTVNKVKLLVYEL